MLPALLPLLLPLEELVGSGVISDGSDDLTGNPVAFLQGGARLSDGGG